MKISKTLETPDGTVEFSGEINQEELDFILTVGLNYLMQQGAIPFQIRKEADLSGVVEGSESHQ